MVGREDRRQRDDQIVERYRAGEPTHVIADDVGLTSVRIRQILVARGEIASVSLGPRESKRQPVAERDDWIVERYRTGETTQVIADDVDLSDGRIRQILVGRGEIASPTSEHRQSERRRMAERADSIVGRYRAGETMQAIADDVGVSRARVHQILGARGEVGAASLAARKSRRADALRAEVDGFLEQHGATIEALADQGLSKQQILKRFRLLFPELAEATTQKALDTSGIAFSQPVAPIHFPDAVLELGVWYMLGLDLQLDADRGAALTSIDFDEASDLRQALAQRGFSDERCAEVLAVAVQARELATTTASSLSNARYTKLRMPTVASQQSSQGLFPWPADSQTVMKRLGNGYWSEAMVKIGLTPNDGGRSKGLLLFSEDAYVVSLEKYVDDRRAAGATTSFDDYDVWRRREYRDGRTWPSAVAVRNRYGSWRSAMRSMGATTGGATSTSEPAREASLSAKTLHLVREEMDRRLKAIRRVGPPSGTPRCVIS